MECEFGCGETGCNVCNTSTCEQHIIPKYLPAICDDLATTDLTVSANLTLDTDDDASCTSVAAQPTGPEICIVHHQSISILENQTLTVTGTRAIALVGDRGVDVRGILDASASTTLNGPGGGFKKSGSGGSLAGGGAGHHTRGGHGGSNTDGGATNGGLQEPSPASLAELFGGTQPTLTSPGKAPGGAGGAVALICCRCTAQVIGVVDVGGGGGRGGENPLGGGVAPPGGGGAGGTVVLQGLGVEVTGQIFANGGGGGGGGLIVERGDPGEDGTRSATCASGGLNNAGAVSGGAGGCATADARDGRAAVTNGPPAGAGGGSTGFLLTYTPQGVAPLLNPLLVSPAFETNGTIATN
ncbi:MAG: hypothetical protein H0V17_14570 [Deltaproteobacteria bacterium]|nr:hypothetical protein [Deltaproteobacteria bacterium]